METNSNNWKKRGKMTRLSCECKVEGKNKWRTNNHDNLHVHTSAPTGACAQTHRWTHGSTGANAHAHTKKYVKQTFTNDKCMKRKVEKYKQSVADCSWRVDERRCRQRINYTNLNIFCFNRARRMRQRNNKNQ